MFDFVSGVCYNFIMIKLVASDLDGTLLPPDKILPENLFALIEKLYKKGIIFAPASGRQLPNLKKLFAPVLDKIAIIAENGGIVWYGGEIIYTNPTPSADVLKTLEAVEGVSGLYPLLSCADCAYYQSNNPKFIEVVKKSYSYCKKVENLKNIAKTSSVIKISVWDEAPPSATHGAPLLTPALPDLRVMASGYDWLDVSTSGANKGNALQELMKKLKCERDGCAAFGDHMNDLEMLQACGHPYVVKNAFALLKEKFKNEVPSNAEFGVIKKLEELL